MHLNDKEHPINYTSQNEHLRNRHESKPVRRDSLACLSLLISSSRDWVLIADQVAATSAGGQVHGGLAGAGRAALHQPGGPGPGG